MNKTAESMFRENMEELIKVSIPQNGIDLFGFEAAKQVIWQNCLQSESEDFQVQDFNYRIYYLYREILSEIHEKAESEEVSPWQKWLVTKGEFVGTWPKRFKNYVYKNSQIKIDPDLLSKIGEIISRHAQTKDKEYFCEFVQNVEWNAGDFQEDEGSCWWDSYNDAREALIAHPSGGAILFYESESLWQENRNDYGIGRCWFWLEGGSIYIFNGYGHNLVTMARVISTKLGLSYQKVDFEFRNAWINGNTAYELFSDKSRGSTDVKIRIDTRVECYRCNVEYPADDMRYWQGDPYCQECYDEYFTECGYCGNIGYSDHMMWIEHRGESICHSCLHRHFAECDACHEMVGNDDITTTEDGYTFCEDCASDNTQECADCGNTFSDRVDFNEVSENRLVCFSCYCKVQDESVSGGA